MKILYLEDDPGVNRAISGLLRAKGHLVTSYHSARPAIDHLEEVGPDVVVSDWHLEAGTAAAFIRRAATHCPVVVFSGAPECVDRDILDLPNVSTLAKPSTAEVIFRTIETAQAGGTRP